MFNTDCVNCGAKFVGEHIVCDDCIEDCYVPAGNNIFYPDIPYYTPESDKDKYINLQHERRWYNRLAFYKSVDVNMLIWNRKDSAWHEASLPF